MKVRAAAALLLAGSALLPFAACLLEDSVVCEAGDQRACCCGAEVRGYQTCSQNKSGYGACACEADGGDAGGACMDDGSAGGPLKEFMELCDVDKECETGLCFHYNAKPARCSKTCATAADCPPPST